MSDIPEAIRHWVVTAVLVERERCAKIADAYVARMDAIGDAPHAKIAAKNIAAAIRSKAQGEDTHE